MVCPLLYVASLPDCLLVGSAGAERTFLSLLPLRLYGLGAGLVQCMYMCTYHDVSEHFLHCIPYMCAYILACSSLQVRQRAQEAVSQVVRGLPPFTNAIRSIVMELPKYLKEGTGVAHEQFKVSSTQSNTWTRQTYIR